MLLARRNKMLLLLEGGAMKTKATLAMLLYYAGWAGTIVAISWLIQYAVRWIS